MLGTCCSSNICECTDCDALQTIQSALIVLSPKLHRESDDATPTLQAKGVLHSTGLTVSVNVLLQAMAGRTTKATSMTLVAMILARCPAFGTRASSRSVRASHSQQIGASIAKLVLVSMC